MTLAPDEVRLRVRSAVRPLYHRVFGALPTDPTRHWLGTARQGEAALRIAYYGDCAFRAMDRSHGLDTPVGWPAALTRRLAERDVPAEFSLVFMPDYEHLPDRERLTRYLHLSDDPQVVVVHTGGVYARRVIFSDSARMVRLRENIGRRLGHHVFAGYRLVRPVVRLAGRPVTAYYGTQRLERFLAVAGDAWPEATIVVIAPFRRLIAGREQRRLEARLVTDARAAAARAGVDFLDLSDLLRGRPELRCANGYNLSSLGSEFVGERMLEWLGGCGKPYLD